MIEYVTGDLLKEGPRTIAHGCNTKGVMGAGIARPIRDKFPKMYESYHFLCVNDHFVLGDVMPWRQEDPNGGNFLRVYNLMTQTNPGADGNLYGVAIAARDMLSKADAFGVDVIGMPRIGCGIAGLAWADVEEALNVASLKYPHITLQVYTLPSEADKFPVPPVLHCEGLHRHDSHVWVVVHDDLDRLTRSGRKTLDPSIKVGDRRYCGGVS